jgi:tetratricopeptide (TPR) repeat protein
MELPVGVPRFAAFAHGVLVIALLVFPAGAPAQQEGGARETRETAPEPSLVDRAVTALDEGRFVRARELASEVLEKNPDSVIGLYVLASALHEGEGNIPRALHVIRAARQRAETPAPPPSGSVAANWHERILKRHLWILSDLGRYDELIRTAATIRRLYDASYHAADVWPRMKQGEVEQARQAAARAIATGNPYQEIIARNGLCAIDGLEACEEMLRAVRDYGVSPGLALRNLAVAVAASGNYERAEELLIESTQHPTPEANPWSLLTDLYLEEARFAEAAAAAREMVDYARHMPPRERQHARAGELSVSAAVLLLAGEAGRAAALSEEAVDEPDRAAHWSGSSEEIAADIHLLNHAVHRTLAEMAAETASVLPWYASFPQRAEAWGHRLQSWTAARRLMPLLVRGGLRLRGGPEHLSDPSLSAPTWLQLDAVRLLGAGPTLDLVAEMRGKEPAPGSPWPPELREALLDALATEAHSLLGRDREVIARGEAAREALPAADRLLRVRLAARMAEAARRLADWERAAELYDEVLRTEPGTLRRLGVALPVTLGTCRTDVGCEALDEAVGSPRFRREERSPFLLAESGSQLCLATRSGARLACSPTAIPEEPESEDQVSSAEGRPEERSQPFEPLPPERAGDPAARAALALIRTAFTPPIDLTQQDLESLDGAPTSRRGLEKDTLGELMQGP